MPPTENRCPLDSSCNGTRRSGAGSPALLVNRDLRLSRNARCDGAEGVHCSVMTGTIEDEEHEEGLCSAMRVRESQLYA